MDSGSFMVSRPAVKAIADGVSQAGEARIEGGDFIPFLQVTGDGHVLKRQPVSEFRRVDYRIDEPADPLVGELFLNIKRELFVYDYEIVVGVNQASVNETDFHFFDTLGNALNFGWSAPSQLSGSSVTGIAAQVHDGRLYVLDSESDRVVICDVNGDSGTSWTLGHPDGSNLDPKSIAVSSTRVFVIYGDRSVRVYEHDGTRHSEEDFTLVPDNASYAGAAVFTNALGERLYVADSYANKMFVYAADGTRQTSEEFEISVSGNANQVFVYGDYLYVGGEAYVYVPAVGNSAAGFQRAGHADFTMPSASQRWGVFVFTDPDPRWLNTN